MLTDAEIAAALEICDAATCEYYGGRRQGAFYLAARSEQTGWPAALREVQRLRKQLDIAIESLDDLNLLKSHAALSAINALEAET